MRGGAAFVGAIAVGVAIGELAGKSPSWVAGWIGELGAGTLLGVGLGLILIDILGSKLLKDWLD